MNIRFVCLILGGILSIQSVFLAVCLAYSMWSKELAEFTMTKTWIASLICALACAGAFGLVGRGADKTNIFRREAFAVVGLGWIVCGLLGSVPFMLNPFAVAPWDALFETVSGLTTTGATIYKDLTPLPRSLILWRSITQWMGGLGVVVLFVALLGFLGLGGKAIFSKETSALAEGDLKSRAQSLTLRYLVIYLGFTGLGMLGLMACGLGPFDAINHTMCAISTGGFSSYNESVAHFSQAHAQAWLILIMFLGGIGLPVHFHFWVARDYGVVYEHRETSVYAWIVLIAAGIISVDLIVMSDMPPTPKLFLDAMFQTVSIMTTTGFVTADFDKWPALSVTILLCLMMVGGCAGSTAGGLKVARIVVFAKAAARELRSIFRPQLVLRIRLNGHAIEETIVRGVMVYFAFYFVLMTIGVLGLAILEPNMDLTSTFSAMVASFNNVGPGLGEVGPTANYASLNAGAKLWLCLFMLLGRLELYVILLLLVPSFWRKF